MDNHGDNDVDGYELPGESATPDYSSAKADTRRSGAALTGVDGSEAPAIVSVSSRKDSKPDVSSQEVFQPAKSSNAELQ